MLMAGGEFLSWSRNGPTQRRFKFVGLGPAVRSSTKKSRDRTYAYGVQSPAAIYGERDCPIRRCIDESMRSPIDCVIPGLQRLCEITLDAKRAGFTRPQSAIAA
jgi:hypothetical protein